MPDFVKTCNKIYRIASSNASEYQPWDGYYLVRIVELEIISNLLELKEDYTVLEIGCGNGFYSALLSPHVKKVFTGDLETANANTHTMGIAKAKGLLKKLNISNVNLASFSGVNLPFRSGVFDLVFTSSTLEHISDRVEVIKEIKRVLKPEGKAIIIVPNFTTSIYSVLHLPLYLCMAVCRRIIRKKSSNRLPDVVLESREKRGIFTMLLDTLKPKTHGEYKNVFDELLNLFPCKWEGLFTDGDMKVLASRGTIILPWSLISVFSSHFGALLYNFTKDFHKTIVVKYDFFKYFSYLNCFVLKR